jgi:MFS family permease
MRPVWHLGLGRDLGLAFWALTLFEATIGAYASVWPIWIERLGAPITIVGLLLGLSGIIRPFVLLPSSALFERFDARRIMLAARVLSIVGLLIAALATTWWILLVTIVLNTLGEVVFASIHSYVADNSGANKVRAFNLVVTIGPACALIVAPIVSGLVISIWGIPAAFVLASITTVGALVFVAQMNFRRHHSDDGDTRVPSYGEVFQHIQTRQIFLVHGFTIMTLSIGVSLIPNYLEDFRGISASTISILSAGAAVGTGLFALATGRIPKLHTSPLFAAAIATGFVIAAMLLMAIFNIVPIIALAYVFRGGLFSAWVLFISAVGERTPARLRSRAFIVLEILGGGAMSFGPIVSAQLYRFDPRYPLLFAALIAAAMILVILRVERSMGPVAGSPVLAEPTPA